jgi:hypothetical protein
MGSTQILAIVYRFERIWDPMTLLPRSGILLCNWITGYYLFLPFPSFLWGTDRSLDGQRWRRFVCGRRPRRVPDPCRPALATGWARSSPRR